MPSYLRYLFGGGSNSSDNKKRSSSQPRAQPPPPPQHATNTTLSEKPSRQRTYSHSGAHAAHPSPLRYATNAGDTRTVLGYGKHTPPHAPVPELRPQVLRRASHSQRDPPPYALHTPSVPYATPPSSRSNSSTSLYGPHPVSSSSDIGHGVRPPLRQNHTWQSASSVATTSSYGSRGNSPARSATHSQAASAHSGSYCRPRTPTLHMHPLLSHTRLHHAPLTYDVTFTPSARTVLDRATHTAIPAHTLQEPATEPPTAATGRLVLRSHKFPWPVVVRSSTTSTRARFTIGPPPPPLKDEVLTVLDVLYAVHTTLMAPVTQEEWEALGHGSRAQQKATRAYERRCTRFGGGWEGGVRRVDWLGEKTQLVGIESDKLGPGAGAGKLVFGKA